MDTSEGLVNAAEGMALGTAALMPASLSCFFLMDGGKGKDGELRTAAGKWGEAADKYNEAKEHLEGLVRGVSAHSWSGKDRDAFEQEVSKIGRQLGTDNAYAKGAQITLDLMAVALDVFAGFAMAVGIALVAQAAICAAADCTIIGAPAAELEANAFALDCADMLETANQVLQGVMGGGAALFQGGAIADAAQQDSEGDGSALGNLKQAEIKGGVEGAKAIANHMAGHFAGRYAGNRAEESAGAGLTGKAKVAAKKIAEKEGDWAGDWFGETGSKTVLNKVLPEEEGGDNGKGGEEETNPADAGSYA